MEAARIEAFLLEKGDVGDRLLLEAQMQLDASLAQRVNDQKQAYDYAIAHGRQLLREEISKVDEELFTHSKHQRFRNKVLSYFKFL